MAERHDPCDIRGVIPALMTCFAEDGEHDEKRQRAVVRHLLGKKTGALYLTGCTGEAFVMTAGERKPVVETVMDEVSGRLPVIAHVGAIRGYCQSWWMKNIPSDPSVTLPVPPRSPRR